MDLAINEMERSIMDYEWYTNVGPDTNIQLVTLTKHPGFEKPDNEQLHILPLYILDTTDKFGSEEGLCQNVRTGSLEVVNNYPIQARIRAYPLTPKTQGKGKKDSPSKKLQRKSEGARYSQQSPKDPNASHPDKQLQYQMMQHLQYQRYQQLQAKTAGKMGEQMLCTMSCKTTPETRECDCQIHYHKVWRNKRAPVFPNKAILSMNPLIAVNKFGRFPPQHLPQSKL